MPERSGKRKRDKGVETLVDQIVANMRKLWPSVNKSYYKVRKRVMELFSLYGCERFGADESSPISVDSVVKSYYDADDEDKRDDIVNSLSEDAFGVVTVGEKVALSRKDYIEYAQKAKSVKGALSDLK